MIIHDSAASGLSRRELIRKGAAMAALAAFSPIAQTEENTRKEKTMTQTSADKNAIRPFPRVNIPEADLSDLRRRINATKVA